MQIADEYKSSHGCLGYRLCILNLKFAYFIHKVISACIARKCDLFIIQKLSTYLSILLAHSQNVQPFTELDMPADTATAPVNTTILSSNYNYSHTLFWSKKELPPFYSSAQ